MTSLEVGFTFGITTLLAFVALHAVRSRVRDVRDAIIAALAAIIAAISCSQGLDDALRIIGFSTLTGVGVVLHTTATSACIVTAAYSGARVWRFLGERRGKAA